MDGVGASNVCDASLRKTEKSYLALFDEIADCASHVLDRHGPINAMLIEQINVVGTKPAEASLHCFADMLGPTVRTDNPVTIETRSKLRSDHYLVAPASECATEQLLVGERTVVLRRVEEGASQFDRAMNSGDRFSFIRRTVRLTHAHTAEADR